MSKEKFVFRKKATYFIVRQAKPKHSLGF
jgi:hypothetical protein